MTYDTIHYRVEDGVATITLHRPDVYNALSQQMTQELLDVLDHIATDKLIRAVVLTGAGKGFTSGADLVELSGYLGDDIPIAEILRNGLNRLILAIRALQKPVICAVNGVAAGAGAILPLAADYRIASTQASFVFASFANIGIVPDAGGTYLLQQIVGVGKALELFLLADAQNRISAEDAFALGIVNRVVPDDVLLPEANTLALRMAQMPTRAVGLTKQAVYRAAERSLADSLEYEAGQQAAAFQTADFQEGVAAFIEKRKPIFKGV